jgi:mono/diheme cytochrome c family protein
MNLRRGIQMKKLMKWIGIVLGGLIGLSVPAGLVLYPIGLEKFTRSYPNIAVAAVNIPSDIDAVARGKHIAIVWECTKCHGEDLSGKLLSDDPIFGTMPASNLTSGQGGIGQSYTDVDWVRAIRHGVKPDNRVIVGMYDYYFTMSDRDLGDLIAYLKQIPPIDTVQPATNWGPIRPIGPAVGLFTPMAEVIDHSAPRPADPVAGATLEYGRYLSVLCTHCHSQNFGGKLAKWQPDDFVRAVRSGVLPNGKRLGKAMTAPAYSKMDDTELTALWLYVQNLLPAKAQK